MANPGGGRILRYSQVNHMLRYVLRLHLQLPCEHRVSCSTVARWQGTTASPTPQPFHCLSALMPQVPRSQHAHALRGRCSIARPTPCGQRDNSEDPHHRMNPAHPRGQIPPAACAGPAAQHRRASRAPYGTPVQTLALCGTSHQAHALCRRRVFVAGGERGQVKRLAARHRVL